MKPLKENETLFLMDVDVKNCDDDGLRLLKLVSRTQLLGGLNLALGCKRRRPPKLRCKGDSFRGSHNHECRMIDRAEQNIRRFKCPSFI
jgi:hypothetical protein